MSASAAVLKPTRLPPLPSIRDLVKLYRLRAIKQLSQNFLLDSKLTNKIVRAASIDLHDCYACEVGPGPGGITRSILEKGAKKVYLIEKDVRFKNSLKLISDACPGRVETYWGDVLSFNLSKIFPQEVKKPWNESGLPPIHIIGNLPFNIATPLIIKWLRCISEQSNAWSLGRVPLTLTFQHEVAERLVADVMDVQRCRLSIMAQYLTYPKYVFTIPGSAFVPKPDVDVGVVKFVPRKTPLISVPFPVVEKLVRQMFHFKNKLAWKGISTLFPFVIRRKLAWEMFEMVHVNPKVRPTMLTIEEISKLCDAYVKICDIYPVKDYNYRGFKPDEQWENVYGSIYGYWKLKDGVPKIQDDIPFDYEDEDLLPENEEDEVYPLNYNDNDNQNVIAEQNNMQSLHNYQNSHVDNNDKTI